MKVAFYGGQTAGIIVLLALISRKLQINYVIPEDQNIKMLAKIFGLKTRQKSTLNDAAFINVMAKNVDLLICCHGKNILNNSLINNVKSINLHPCLYKYKGANPIERLIAEGNPLASVASHWMTKRVDGGKMIVEEYLKISDVKQKTAADIYNLLYPLYVKVLIKTLEKIS